MLRKLIAPDLVALEDELATASARRERVRAVNKMRKRDAKSALKTMAASPAALGSAAFAGFALGSRGDSGDSEARLDELVGRVDALCDTVADSARDLRAAAGDSGADHVATDWLQTALRTLSLVSLVKSLGESAANALAANPPANDTPAPFDDPAA